MGACLGLATLDARGQGFPVKVLADEHHLDDYLLSVSPASLTGPKLNLLVHAVEDKLLVAEGGGLRFSSQTLGTVYLGLGKQRFRVLRFQG